MVGDGDGRRCAAGDEAGAEKGAGAADVDGVNAGGKLGEDGSLVVSPPRQMPNRQSSVDEVVVVAKEDVDVVDVDERTAASFPVDLGWLALPELEPLEVLRLELVELELDGPTGAIDSPMRPALVDGAGADELDELELDLDGSTGPPSNPSTGFKRPDHQCYPMTTDDHSPFGSVSTWINRLSPFHFRLLPCLAC